MKRIIASLIFATGIAYVSAQTPISCTDITAGLSRGTESQNVLALQRFLFAKGHLKATPNGYFGPATFAAVKQYQASVGISATGGVFTLTRAAIKNESCGPSTNQNIIQGTVSTQTVSYSQTQNTQTVYYPRPVLYSAEKGSLFTNASSSWNIVLSGSAFSQSSNKVYVRNVTSGRKYLLGAYAAENSTTLSVPATFLTSALSCGTWCNEKLQPGGYEILIETEGGESNSLYTAINGITISSMPGSPYAALRQNALSAKIGVVTFSSSIPVYITSLNANITLENLQEGSVTNLVFRDEMTGQEVLINDVSTAINANQSKIIGIYGDINSQTSGLITGSVTVGVTDFIGNKENVVISPVFYNSVSGF